MMMVPASSTVSLISLCGRTIVPFRNTSSCAAWLQMRPTSNVHLTHAWHREQQFHEMPKSLYADRHSPC